MDRCFLPGWTTLTWNTLNIDAFLHQVESATNLLGEVSSAARTILRESVYGEVEEMANMNLLDRDLFFSQPWVSSGRGCTQSYLYGAI